MTPPVASPREVTLIRSEYLHLFNEGTHYRVHEKLGAHLLHDNGGQGTAFAVWAPNAREVSVIGSFNGWDRQTHKLQARGNSGIWEGFISGVDKGALYKFHIRSHHHAHVVDKADPYGLFHEKPPRTASVVWNLNYDWGDQEWMRTRGGRDSLNAPISIYEVHLGSWMRVPEEHNRPLTYRETAPRLAEYVQHMGFTHVEFLPVMEHPFYGSWGYQTTGYFAPTSRYGTPQDFMWLIDRLHQAGIGVILDWVPSHFPSDQHGLGFFDGTHLYEHADPRRGRACPGPPTWAGWGSASSGTWGGCTTRFDTCPSTPSIERSTTTTSPSARSTPGRRTSSSPCRTTRWFTGRAPWPARWQGTNGRSWPTSGCYSATCTPRRGRSCCSWGGSSASGANGTTTRAWTGTSWST